MPLLEDSGIESEDKSSLIIEEPDMETVIMDKVFRSESPTNKNVYLFVFP